MNINIDSGELFITYAAKMNIVARLIVGDATEAEDVVGDVFADVANGDLSKVTGWLKEHIHRHASFKKPGQLFEEVCGEFDASCFTDYLTQKYTELYNLK